MDYHRILEKKKIYDAGKSTIDAITISSYEKDFELTFTHNYLSVTVHSSANMEIITCLHDDFSICADGGNARL